MIKKIKNENKKNWAVKGTKLISLYLNLVVVNITGCFVHFMYILIENYFIIYLL